MTIQNVKLTYAVPVDAIELAVRIETHVRMLPTQEMLHLCARFGQGPYPKLPVEVVQKIESYLARPVREKVAQELASATSCFENRCSFFDHVDREALLQVYSACMEYMDPGDFAPFPTTDPTDAELEDVFQHESFAKLVEDRAVHEKNKVAWVKTIRRIFSTTHRSIFQRRFELDIWFSFVRLPAVRYYRTETDVPQATIAYLTLPGSTMCQHSWANNETARDGQDNPIKISSCGENGFGMAVEPYSELSKKQLSDFQTAMDHLNLKACGCEIQKQYPALSIGVLDPDSSKDAEISDKPEKAGRTSRDSRRHQKKTPTAPLPKLTLLTRNDTRHVGPNF